MVARSFDTALVIQKILESVVLKQTLAGASRADGARPETMKIQ